jgi:hypothetical protein
VGERNAFFAEIVARLLVRHGLDLRGNFLQPGHQLRRAKPALAGDDLILCLPGFRRRDLAYRYGLQYAGLPDACDKARLLSVICPRVLFSDGISSASGIIRSSVEMAFPSFVLFVMVFLRMIFSR